MARYKQVNYDQAKLLPVSFSRQILPGSFEYTLSYIVDNALDLQHYPLLCLDRGDSLDMELRQRLAQRNVTVPMNIETTYSATICVFAAQGIGLGIVNPYIASVFWDRVAVRRFTPRIKVTTYASNARFSPASELTGKFLKALVDHIRATQWD